MFNIPVILGSVRKNRKSFLPAKLMVERIKQAGADSQLVDFIDLPLPFVNCEKEPVEYEKNYPDPNVQKWSAIADAADAFVLVTPEYNHGYSAVLKNALDWLYPEFERKVAGLVGVSTGILGGARAVEQLRPIVETFSMFAIREVVLFGKVESVFNKQGELMDESFNKKIDRFLKSLFWSAEAMKTARN